MKFSQSMLFACVLAYFASISAITIKHYDLNKEPLAHTKASTTTHVVERMKVPVIGASSSTGQVAPKSNFGTQAASAALNALQAGFAGATFIGLGFTSYQLYKIFKNWWYEKHKNAGLDKDYEANEKLWAKVFFGLLGAAGATVLANVNWQELATANPYKDIIHNTVTTNHDVKRSF